VAVVPGANIGDDCAVFDAVHGSAPDLAGKNVANPTGLVLSSVMMLRHIGEQEAADRIQGAIFDVLAERKTLTPDLGGTATTTEMAEAVIGRLGAKSSAI
jgi:isocitrate dehydrogenase (NAD+)